MDNAQIYEAANQAGMTAAAAVTPVPMIVSERANPLDNSSPVVRQYAPIEGGACGFASVTVKPANCAFAKYLKSEHRGRKGYYGGVCLSVSAYGQSLARKEAYADAFAQVLKAAGITAYAESRLD